MKREHSVPTSSRSPEIGVPALMPSWNPGDEFQAARKKALARCGDDVDAAQELLAEGCAGPQPMDGDGHHAIAGFFASDIEYSISASSAAAALR